MIDMLQLMAFNAAYAQIIDSDELERWPACFTEHCHYRITHVENEQEGLPAGVVWADSRAMLEDRVAALREANIYERQRYRHLLGAPLIESADAGSASACKVSAPLIAAIGPSRDQLNMATKWAAKKTKTM